MEQKQPKVILALAITSVCNLKCFYCKDSGENLDNALGTIEFNNLKSIVKVAYKNGIKNYRITGGEPTTVHYFGELLEYIMELGKDSKIRISTNGYKILNYMDMIEKCRERMEIVISVDSLNKKIGKVEYEKYLSEQIINITKKLLDRKIKVRYNIVITKENINATPELILKALDLGVNIKLLDLIKHDEYFEKNKEESNNFFKNSYQSIDDIKQFLRSITDRYQENFNMLVSTGIPMSRYLKGNQYIQVKDSNRGSTFSEECVNNCSYFDKCQEGMFSPFISNNGILSISNCKNKNLRWNLLDMNDEEKDKSFKEILKLFSNTKIYNNFKV